MMKKIKKLLPAVIILATPLLANGINITITAQGGGVADPLFDAATGTNQITPGTLGILLVDTNGDGISLDATMISDESFWGSTDNYIAGITGSSVLSGFGDAAVVGFSSESADNGALAQGQEFYIAWFPGLTDSSTTITAGQIFGLTRDSSWVLPSDGGSFTGITAPGGNADFVVGAIPEPSTYAMFFGLASLIYVLRRSVLSSKLRK